MKNSVPIVVQTVAKHSYWVESIFTGLRKSAEKSDYELEYIDDAQVVERADYPEHCSIIVIGYVVDWLYQSLNILLEKGFHPIVVNAGVSKGMLNSCSGVFFQLENSVENTLKYLSDSGRKNISLFGTNTFSLADRIKEETFKRLAGSYNDNGSSLVIQGGNPINENIENFLSLFEEQEIDAVICPNDTVAIHLINRMVKEGFKLPEDLYVVGMGNSQLGQNISIPLSSIDFDYEELGCQAFGLWKYIQRSNADVHIEVSIPCKFIPRASTGDFTQIETRFMPIFRDIVSDREMETNCDEFYEDVDMQKIITFEVFLRSCDEIDYYVLEGILQGMTDAKMAEQYNISDRAIRYRINKMTKKLGVQTRDEIVSIIRDLRAFDGKE